jgi:hypothetical protein
MWEGKMKVNVRAILEDALDRGMEQGHMRVIKHLEQEQAQVLVDHWPQLRDGIRNGFFNELSEYLVFEGEFEGEEGWAV